MDQNDYFGCITLSILSIVIFTFVKYQDPKKHSQIIRKLLNFDSEWETPSLQNLWLQCEDLHCTVSDPFEKLHG